MIVITFKINSMSLKSLNKRPHIQTDRKLNIAYLQFEKLIEALKDKSLPDSIVDSINASIEGLNSISDSAKDLRSQIKAKQSNLIKLLEKEIKIVPKNYYCSMWLSLGIGAIGIPMGVAFGAILGNMAYLSIGLPIGLGVGVAIGTSMDKKALKEGRQLNIEISG
jgi:hypothetical protein